MLISFRLEDQNIHKDKPSSLITDVIRTQLEKLCKTRTILTPGMYVIHIRSFHTKLSDDDAESLKGMLKGLQQLENMEVECSDQVKSLEVIAKHSPKLFHELKSDEYLSIVENSSRLHHRLEDIGMRLIIIEASYII